MMWTVALLGQKRHESDAYSHEIGRLVLVERCYRGERAAATGVGSASSRRSHRRYRRNRSDGLRSAAAAQPLEGPTRGKAPFRGLSFFQDSQCYLEPPNSKAGFLHRLRIQLRLDVDKAPVLAGLGDEISRLPLEKLRVRHG